MHKLTKAEVMREVKDYAYITLGLISYSLGWAAFLLPYQITTGGTTGISAIIYYSTGFPIQWSYFIINAVLMTFAIRILGPRFSIKTTYAIFMLTFLLWLFQLLVNNYVEVPDMQQNIEGVIAIIRYIYYHIMYAELNCKSDYCQVCGFDGEIQIEELDGKLIWKCPVCGNTDQNKMNVARRTCGYIGTQFWNQGRTEEIRDRVLHVCLDEQPVACEF